MGYEYHKNDHLVYEAVYNDDWSRVSKIFSENPELRTKTINPRLETPLMIAVGTNRSHKFVKFLLYSLFTERDGALVRGAVAAKNEDDDTPFHYVAKIGNMIDALELIRYAGEGKAAELLQHINGEGYTPVFYAAWLGRKKEMLKCFYSMTGVYSSPSLESGMPNRLGPLLKHAIDAGFLDIALTLVETYSKGNKRDLQLSLNLLAKKPNLFSPQSKHGFWSFWSIYYLLPVYTTTETVSNDEKTTSQQDADDEEAMTISRELPKNTCGTFTYECTRLTARFLDWISQYLPPPIKKIYDMKRRHKQTKILLARICKTLKETSDEDAVVAVLSSTLIPAVEHGNYDVINACIQTYPKVIWTDTVMGIGFENLLHQAIKERREQVYSLVYKMCSCRVLVLSEKDNETDENILHLAAKLAPSHRLSSITGAALQMQRELQWFKEVESIVEPSLKHAKNKKGKTPRMVFNEEHAELLQQGKEWMKDTSSSSTVVAALIVTVAFAAIFTLPGGEESKKKIAFSIFIISDAIALFTSATSALLFLGILTSRYAESDFLEVLPRILMLGIFSLFLSSAATMIAFSATLALVLENQVSRIAAPLVIITTIPIGLFVLIQRPLLFEMFRSTYGRSIFRK